MYKNPVIHNAVMFFYLNFFFNELSHSNITNGEIPAPSMTFIVSYVIAKTL